MTEDRTLRTLVIVVLVLSAAVLSLVLLGWIFMGAMMAGGMMAGGHMPGTTSSMMGAGPMPMAGVFVALLTLMVVVGIVVALAWALRSPSQRSR